MWSWHNVNIITTNKLLRVRNTIFGPKVINMCWIQPELQKVGFKDLWKLQATEEKKKKKNMLARLHEAVMYNGLIAVNHNIYDTAYLESSA